MPLAYQLLLMISVYAAEHWLLAHRYGTTSSLQKLVAFGPSARTDLAFLVVYFIAFRWLFMACVLICVPGLLYLGAAWLVSDVTWTGLMGGLGLHPLLAMVVVLVTTDFALYWSHRAMHAVPLLWRMHQVHHAAEEMTIANGSRMAVGEVFVNMMAILFVTEVLFGAGRPEIAMPVIIIRGAFDAIQHSDLPWSYGRLGKVFASPRFHRVHHSCHSADHNSHFADLLAVWDYAFGTVSPRYRADPAALAHCPIGLDDDDYPERLNGGLRTLLHESLPHQAWQFIASDRGIALARRLRLRRAD
jgi:sterol desaturase/sphingolipid hydroxylase (fatty acid hydroxylase superfamily)